MAKDYVEHRNNGYYIEGARVSLDSIVYAYLRGESAEGIAETFPALRLEQIFGALVYYAAHREKIDRYLAESHQEFEALREQARQRHPALYAKLLEARQRSHSPRA